MTRFISIFICVFAVSLAIAEAGSRVRRTPQFSQASARATAFGGNRNPPGPGFGGPGFGRPGFGGPGFGDRGFGGPGFGDRGFGGPGFGDRGFGGPSDIGRPGSNFGRPGGNFGGPGGNFGGPGNFGGRGFVPNRPGGPGLNINVAKSVSISSGRGNSLSSATAGSRG